MNILIIDDQRFIRETMKADIHKYLAEDNVEIYEASNGNQGIELILAVEAKLDLVILDLKMDQGDGIAVINMLASEPRFTAIPIAVISSSDKRTLELVDSIITGLKLNLLGVFAKPINVNDILTPLLDASDDRNRAHQDESIVQDMAANINVRQLLKNEQLILCYQPKINLKTKEIIGFEVLSRLCDQSNGYIYPDVFLPLVNQQGLNSLFSRMVISQALQCWSRQPLLMAFALSINITADDLTCDELIEYIIECGREYKQIHLILELTESQEIINQDRVLNSIARLIINNIDISLDDFGKSYSTYDRLDAIPFKEIKIDKSFVSDMDINHQHYLIVESTIALAQKMHVKVVAEGVETSAIELILSELGCDVAQGYLYSPPIEGRYLIDWIAQYNRSA
ncbi:EAL domain-containing response regulator [Shewanella sp. NKUCC05_KAH]|uniref:EAL domain-containing response regulator n=1 Tax=Shewanella oncorhynchi TaxID=2726434 RepID=A0AA50Q4S2_9GAMM|nr:MULTISPECIES: EAL domain-containing response regulator [Shewanella]MBS0043612.1 EAL domain-containing response regulator [Shewanella sp. M16]MBW3514563.1 EAL domain-containing response regulator [Shewanella sp. NKUCC01_JLK]MBW3525053.1 EAL domain-containing response regulator [Shewanella sp. NKUCC05_KAH]MBW3530771.1 EAL domain-containing response regulator [Shewanella sp. NKUCC06_TVS]MCU7987326.1 EAL domain-containing response regulator [Shewanella sp. SW24]